MRTMLFTTLALLLVAVPALAQAPPVNGLYNSITQGGTVLDGRFSESWMAAGGEGMPDNTLNVASWDGVNLGTEWKVWCASQVGAPTLVSDTRVGGTGDVVYQAEYSGGRFWLSQNGPWSADGFIDFTGNVEQLTVVSTHQYVGGVRIGVRSNVTVTGTFDQLFPNWAPTCMDYMISNTSIFGTTNDAALPGGYPGFLDPNTCPTESATGQFGSWGSVTQITMLITGCAVPTEAVSWGSLKSRHGER